MTTTTTREADTMTETTTHVLRIKWTTSRGRDTYGWNIVTLTDETTGKRFRANGGGYDMVGTVFGDWLAATFPEELQRWADGTPDLDYGAFRRADGSVYLDGACGLEQMRQVGDALGLEVIRTHDRKGNTTGWLVTLPA